MSLYARLMARGEYPYGKRLVPPAEPPDLLPSQPRRRFCGRCEVGWTGGPVCWCCGEAGR